MQDMIHEIVRSIIKYQVFSKSYLSQRFALPKDGIARLTRVSGEWEHQVRSNVPFNVVDGVRFWTLRGGATYNIVSVEDDIARSKSEEFLPDKKGKEPVEIFELLDSLDDEDDQRILIHNSQCSSGLLEKSLRGNSLSSMEDCFVHKESLDGSLKIYRILALQTVLEVKGQSKISRFVQRGRFITKQVRCLPPAYNGDTIFELPSSLGDVQKGERVRSMERAKDCYYWTRIVPTSANVPKNIIWEFGKVLCTGLLECRNDNCPDFECEGSGNRSSWSGQYKMSNVHKVNCQVANGGLLCGFCNQRPYCILPCLAMMFYMYPCFKLPEDVNQEHMSRLVIHQGYHVHPPRKVFLREAVDKMESLVKKHSSSNPLAAPSVMRNNAIGELICQFDPESLVGLTPEEEVELWESLQVISTPHKFLSLLRSVRKDGRDWKGNGLFNVLHRMQQNIIFPYIKRYHVPGQGLETDFPYVFKMSIKGARSGVDILRRMQPGENLFKTWVMFDIMRLDHKWMAGIQCPRLRPQLSSSLHHFTCELMAEDATLLEIAWLQMSDVAQQYGVPLVHIHAFMADNEIAGWNFVQNFFFSGTRDPDRDRLDAFHWEKALCEHTIEGIKEGCWTKHKALWRKLRDAKNVVSAHRISKEINDWWNA